MVTQDASFGVQRPGLLCTKRMTSCQSNIDRRGVAYVRHFGSSTPFTMTISTRGNGEALVIFMLVMQMKLLQSGKVIFCIFRYQFPVVYGARSASLNLVLVGERVTSQVLRMKLYMEMRMPQGLEFVPGCCSVLPCIGAYIQQFMASVRLCTLLSYGENNLVMIGRRKT